MEPDPDEGVDSEGWGICPNDRSPLQRTKVMVGTVVGQYPIRIAKCLKCEYFEELDD